MNEFAFPKLEKFGLIAFVLLIIVVPVYAASSYQGTVGEVSYARWLGGFIVLTEAAVVILAFLAGWRPMESWKMLPKYTRFALLLWLAVASIATAFSSHVAFSATFQLFWIIHGLFAWALWSMLTTKWAAMGQPLLIYFSLALLLHSLFVYFVAWVLLGLDLEQWEPYCVGTTNPRLYIFYAAALLGLGLGLLVAARNRLIWILAIILTFAAYHLFAWSGGRASFGTSLLVPLLLAMLARKKWKRIVTVAITCAIIAFPLTLITAPSHDWFGLNAIIGRIFDNSFGAAENEYSSGRFQLWTLMLSQSFESPIFGHGQIGTLQLPPKTFPIFGFALHPHNAVVHIFHAWGGMGLIAFGAGLLPFLYTIRARLEAQPLVAWPAFVSLLALAATSMFDGTLFYNQPLFFCALFIAMLSSVPANSKEKSQVDTRYNPSLPAQQDM